MTRRQLSSYRANKIGVIFQTFNLLSHRTAVENVELALYFSGVERVERRSRSRQVLEMLGLGDRLDHRPGDLSGGEQQRVAAARALVKEREVIFADEPTGNLDRENAVQIAELLGKLNRDGLTVVMVTHDERMAHAYAHRLLRMHYGRLTDTESSGDTG
jgi:putative ABC transport system ATP-binding protein